MNPAPSEFRRGWKIVLASALGVGIGVSGAPFYTLGVFLKPLSGEFGWNRAQLSASTLFLTFGYTLASPIVGRFADRLDVRKIALISLVGLALGFIGLTQINGSIASLYFGLSVLAIAGCGTSPLIWGHAINSWFDRSRGMALGLALGGGGVAGIIAPRAVDSLIQAYGWQAGYIGLALYAVLIVLPVVAIFFRERKAAPVGNARADVSLPGMTVAQAFRSVRFWQLTAGIMCVSGALTAIFIHLIPLMTDAGLSRGEATEIAGILGFALLAGRIGGGLRARPLPCALCRGHSAQHSGAGFSFAGCGARRHVVLYRGHGHLRLCGWGRGRSFGLSGQPFFSVCGRSARSMGFC